MRRFTHDLHTIVSALMVLLVPDGNTAKFYSTAASDELYDLTKGGQGGTVDATSSDAQQRQVDVAAGHVRVFIKYRRSDTQGEAQLLYERLANRFGSENVFLDVRSLHAGMKWLDEIKSHSDSSHVFLSLIGPRWISIMRAREQAAIVNPAEDYVRSEIQRVLRPNSGIRVVPVVVGANVSIKAEDLPRSLRALAELQKAQIREEHLDQDIEVLIGRLEEIAREQPTIPSESATAREEDRRPRRPRLVRSVPRRRLTPRTAKKSFSRWSMRATWCCFSDRG